MVLIVLHFTICDTMGNLCNMFLYTTSGCPGGRRKVVETLPDEIHREREGQPEGERERVRAREGGRE
jgi:hypothetical protein